MNFDDELKWCPKCHKYVKYLQSYNSSYCVKCGSTVYVFSKDDWKKFRKSFPSLE
jgi:hypothetical protein